MRDMRVQQCCPARRVLCTQLLYQMRAGCDGAGNCWIKHNRGSGRTRDPFAAPLLVFVRPYGAYARSRCVDAAALLSGARAACTAATGFAGVAALAIAELSTTEPFVACLIRLLRRGLFSCGPTVLMRDGDAWVRQRCSAGRVLRAQLPPDSQVWRRWQLPR
jgi:hypothetical protein